MREIVLDTETTGLDPFAGHRLVEIGCVELFNLIPTGRVFHKYINPERDMPAEAFRIHGLSSQFLSGHPTFLKVVQEFIEFLGDEAPIVIHNASFDMKFLNYEMERAGVSLIHPDRIKDTLALSRKINPGGRHNLDALCKKYEINNSSRIYHGALLDSELLAEVYLHLNGGRQRELEIEKKNISEDGLQKRAPVHFAYRQFSPSQSELDLHTQFISTLKNTKW
jgi:DNA polymerase-3 subunit epsilon